MTASFLTKDQFNDPNITIGDYTYGSPTVHYPSATSRLWIGKYCSIGWNVRIFLQTDHRPDWISTYPFSVMPQFPTAVTIGGLPVSRGDVRIGNDVWLAPESIVDSGVTVGDGAVVTKASVVFDDVPPYAIVRGNPATIVGYRFGPDQIAALLEIKWWDWPFHRMQVDAPDLCHTDIDAFIAKHRGR
jgi:acetyltransferase-like isoleucine patch superfamily enzyme